MLESYSEKAIEIIEEAKKLASSLGHKIVGTEHLLLAMYKTPDSICRFLLQEEKITYEEIIDTLSKMKIIHKTKNNSSFSKKFQEIVSYSKEIAKLNHSKYVYDEHIFYSILIDEANVAKEILEKLNLKIEYLIEDIEDIFDFKKEDSPFPFLINLQKEPLNHKFVERNNYIKRINYILDKKQKNNPLLIGSAGTGKTTIIEGLAKIIKTPIYQLDLGGVVAGTKYRGELEEKIIKALKFVKERKGIVFIDEIHNIVGAGSNDGSLDVSNILKPYLCKKDISIIGATTLDEYYRFFQKDKALTRRFRTIFIDEPSLKETKNILMNIKDAYESHHNFKITKEEIDLLLDYANIYMPQKAFPDKAIDILDEVGARFKKEEKPVSKLIEDVVFDLTNISQVTTKTLKQLKLYYPQLKEYYLRFKIKELKHNNLLLAYVNKDFDISFLLKDLYKVFHFQKEMVLTVDLENYQDVTTINNLLGSAKGYVGYEEGGLLSEHLLKYPMSLIYFKNYDKASKAVKEKLAKIVSTDVFTDNKARKIYLRNTIFIIHKQKETEKIGFLNHQKQEQVLYLKTIKKSKQDIYYHLLKTYKIDFKEVKKIPGENIEKKILSLILKKQ